MSRYGAVAMTGARALALLGILPGAIVAGAYLLVLTGQLYHQWDVRTAVVLGMAAWGVVGVVELWHEYVRLWRGRVDAERMPVSPRALLLVWALILLPIAGWKVDERPWMAGFLALVALYSLARAVGLLKYATRPLAQPRKRVARPASGAGSGEAGAPGTARVLRRLSRREHPPYPVRRHQEPRSRIRAPRP
jgi:hypothetical protein